MYRCGNKYQDRPCDAGQKGKAVGSTGVDSASSGAAPGMPAGAGGAGPAPVDVDCVQRGKDALKVVWAREGGKTKEDLASEAASSHERNLINDVYRRRGSASQVQASVEADCAVEKQNQARLRAQAEVQYEQQKKLHCSRIISEHDGLKAQGDPGSIQKINQLKREISNNGC